MHPKVVMPAHMAACAAGMQGKFMAFKDAFWKQGFEQYAATRDASHLGKETIDKIAGEIGLDANKFAADSTSDACTARIQADMRELSKFGVNGTPSFFINGRFTMFGGRAAFKKLIDEELAKASGSGVAPADYYATEVLGKGLKTFRSKADAAKGG